MGARAAGVWGTEMQKAVVFDIGRVLFQWQLAPHRSPHLTAMAPQVIRMAEANKAFSHYRW
jgi:FMN phosphatase YigB (HAD superfamily)